MQHATWSATYRGENKPHLIEERLRGVRTTICWPWLCWLCALSCTVLRILVILVKPLFQSPGCPVHYRVCKGHFLKLLMGKSCFFLWWQYGLRDVLMGGNGWGTVRTGYTGCHGLRLHITALLKAREDKVCLLQRPKFWPVHYHTRR